jgi:hypothetical protein
MGGYYGLKGFLVGMGGGKGYMIGRMVVSRCDFKTEG